MAPQLGSSYDQVTDEEIKSTLIKTHGQLNPAARALGVTSEDLRQRFNRNPELQEFRKQVRQNFIDDAILLAKDKFYDRLKRDDWHAIKQVLDSANAKSEGWGASQTVDMTEVIVQPPIDLSKLSIETLEELKNAASESDSEDTEGIDRS